MSKVHVCLTAEYELVDEARRQGLNMSHLFEEALGGALSMEDVREKASTRSLQMQKLLEEITDEDIRKCQEAIKRDIIFAKGWKRAFEKNYGIEVTQKEIIKVFGGR